jgi:hypothetical protein
MSTKSGGIYKLCTYLFIYKEDAKLMRYLTCIIFIVSATTKTYRTDWIMATFGRNTWSQFIRVNKKGK